MKYKLYLIDGTGPSNWPEYRTDMGRGFCAKLTQQHGANAFYLRGPTISGRETWAIADLMLVTIKEDLRDRPKLKIVLVGHSRGGASVMHVAQQLKKEKVDVHGMVLFDAVRRAVQSSPPQLAAAADQDSHQDEIVEEAPIGQIASVNPIDMIPGNVERALHLVRDEEFSFFIQRTKEWKDLEAKVGIAGYSNVPSHDSRVNRYRELRDMHRAMRSACRFNCITPGGVPSGVSFDNTGLLAEAPCMLAPLEKHKFLATHGAMGGAPLDPHTYIKDEKYAMQIENQERASMREVAVRTNGFLRELGVGGEL